MPFFFLKKAGKRWSVQAVPWGCCPTYIRRRSGDAALFAGRAGKTGEA